MEDLTLYEELPSELDRQAGILRARIAVGEAAGHGGPLRVVLVVGCCRPEL